MGGISKCGDAMVREMLFEAALARKEPVRGLSAVNRGPPAEADIRDGREQLLPSKVPSTDEQDQLSPDRHIRLATHGRSSAGIGNSSRMGAVARAIWQRSVSHPRSSNRTCRSTASGSPTGFTARHTAGHVRGRRSRRSRPSSP